MNINCHSCHSHLISKCIILWMHQPITTTETLQTMFILLSFEVLNVFLFQYHHNWVCGIDEGVMHNFDVGSFFTVHSMDKEDEFFTCWHYHSWHCTHCKHLSKDMPTIKRTATSIIRLTKVKHVLIDKNVTLVPITVNKNKSFQCNTFNQNSQCHEDTSINRIMSYLPKMSPSFARE